MSRWTSPGRLVRTASNQLLVLHTKPVQLGADLEAVMGWQVPVVVNQLVFASEVKRAVGLELVEACQSSVG